MTDTALPPIAPPPPSVGSAVPPPPVAPTVSVTPAPAIPTAPPAAIAAIAASQLNVKQNANRANKAKQTAIELRRMHWPDVNEEDLWLLGDKKRAGFAQVPRTLAMIMNISNDITKRKTGKAVPIGKTYLVLWLHVFDEGLVRIDSEEEAAFEAGYDGERSVSTFRNHMNLLKALGFIDFKPGIKGPMQYVLLRNPYKVVKQLRAEGLIPDTQYAALFERASAIGSGRELKE